MIMFADHSDSFRETAFMSLAVDTTCLIM